MMTLTPIKIKRSVMDELRSNKFASIKADDYLLCPEHVDAKQQLWENWQDLEPDSYLKAGANYRFRRFCYFYYNPGTDEVIPFPDSPYFQPEELNSYNGGIYRYFTPMHEPIQNNPFLHQLIRTNFSQFPVAGQMAQKPWKLDVHQVRIVSTSNEVGEPTPEGIHHDENEFVCMHLIERKNAIGGHSGVYDKNKQPIAQYTLSNPMDSLVVWDPHVMHGVTAITQQDSNSQATRDVLIIGYTFEPDLKRPSQVNMDNFVENLKTVQTRGADLAQVQMSEVE